MKKSSEQKEMTSPSVFTSQSIESLHEGQEQKALIKDCTVSCKIGLFQMIEMKHDS